MALLEYKCPCCAGKLEFDSGIGTVKCPFCDTEFAMETFTQLDQELNEEAKDDMNWTTSADEWSGLEEGMVAYQCKSCGAQIVTSENTAASKCPYCDNPIVMMGNLKGDLKPDFIIPFKYDKKAAKEAFANHLKGKKLLPSVFTSGNHIDEIKGIYVPFWVYDSDANASIRYRCSKSRSHTQGDTEITETEYYTVLRAGSMSFSNIPVDGSKQIDNALMESCEPFDFNEKKDFQTAYMAGYVADRYDVKSEECAGRANERIKNSTVRAFASTVQGYSSVEPEQVNVDLKNGTSKYALMPLWILNTTWNNNKYIFAMNGQTGKFVGDLPCDESLKKKYMFSTMGIVAALVFAVLYIIHLL